MPPQESTSNQIEAMPTQAVRPGTSQLNERNPSIMWCPINHEFQIGLIVASTNEMAGDHIIALANPASSCNMVALTLLEETNNDDDVADWCKRHRIESGTIVHWGVAGMDAILNDPTIDGVYVTGVLGDDKTEIIEKALRAGKHVLADDPVTTSVTEYCRLVNLAHQCRRHLQDTTMFVYHHAVREFLDCILDEKSFGEITEIKALFDINPKDGRFRGILDPNDAANERRGVIGDLCRYCAVLGLLIFQRSGRKALSAQITGIARDDKGILNHVVCQVNFEGGASLNVESTYVNYSGTRQSVDVSSDTHSASMGDFVFSNHSLACYRVYEKSIVDLAVGEAIDVEGGPRQEVQVWRRFAQLSTNAYHEDELEHPFMVNQGLFRRYDFIYAAVQSQNIVSALTESMQSGLRAIVLDALNIKIPVKR